MTCLNFIDFSFLSKFVLYSYCCFSCIFVRICDERFCRCVFSSYKFLVKWVQTCLACLVVCLRRSNTQGRAQQRRVPKQRHSQFYSLSDRSGSCFVHALCARGPFFLEVVFSTGTIFPVFKSFFVYAIYMPYTLRNNLQRKKKKKKMKDLHY